MKTMTGKTLGTNCRCAAICQSGDPYDNPANGAACRRIWMLDFSGLQFEVRSEASVSLI